MGSIKLLPYLSYSSSANCKAKSHQLQQRLTGAWLKSSSHIRSNQFQRTEHHVSAVIQSQVAITGDSTNQAVEVVDKIEDYISYIKNKLNTIEDGQISVSPYDTAWIALIKNIDGRDVPQFPSSLTWIVHHQLPDGSWGDQHFFSVYDRLVNTIACIITLKSWNVHAHNIEKGISFVKKNIWKLEDASDAHMTCGFEVVFPALLGRARDLGIDDLPYDIPILRKINAARDKKWKRIPRELMHQATTTLLYSLEAFEDLDWARILKLQSADGSFFTSPSATAFAFIQTQDHNCLKFITNIVQKFDGGAPHSYPVDFFARLWAVDRLQRLGISRFFESEIEDCLTYIFRFWNDNGIYSARDINFSEIDDTSMAFRLLRLQGYDVNPNVLHKFKEGENFCCHSGEVSASTTPMYALYRASQIRFPGEEILEEAYNFSYNFLRNWLAGDQFLDKWIISKDLPNEIKIGVEVPWYASLPRVEAAYYLQHYGGSSDVWIAKTLYRMPDINNDMYLELARLDFKRSQAQHQIEWSYVQGWYENLNVQEFGISKKDLLVSYFLAAATIFEPERAKERIAWAKSQIISKMIRTFFTKETKFSNEQKNVMLKELTNNVVNGSYKLKSKHQVLNIMVEAIQDLSEGFAEGLSHQLKNAWGLWLMKFNQGDQTNFRWEDAELMVTTLNICSSTQFSHNDDVLFHQEYITLSKLINKICHHLSQIPNKKVVEMSMHSGSSAISNINEIETDIQEFTKLVLQESGIVGKNIKQTFLFIFKTFYYCAYFDAKTIDLHIFKVLFEPIV